MPCFNAEEDVPMLGCCGPPDLQIHTQTAQHFWFGFCSPDGTRYRTRVATMSGVDVDGVTPLTMTLRLTFDKFRYRDNEITGTPSPIAPLYTCEFSNVSGRMAQLCLARYGLLPISYQGFTDGDAPGLGAGIFRFSASMAYVINPVNSIFFRGDYLGTYGNGYKMSEFFDVPDTMYCEIVFSYEDPYPFEEFREVMDTCLGPQASLANNFTTRFNEFGAVVVSTDLSGHFLTSIPVAGFQLDIGNVFAGTLPLIPWYHEALYPVACLGQTMYFPRNPDP